MMMMMSGRDASCNIDCSTALVVCLSSFGQIPAKNFKLKKVFTYHISSNSLFTNQFTIRLQRAWDTNSNIILLKRESVCFI